MESRPLSRTKARLIVVAVFLLGFVAGGLSMNLYQRVTAGHGPGHGNGYPTPERVRVDLMEKMKERLGLTADQQEQIGSILNETFEQYSEIKRDTGPRFNAVRQKSRDRIRAVLTEEQLPKFEEMVRESDVRREKMREEHKR